MDAEQKGGVRVKRLRLTIIPVLLLVFVSAVLPARAETPSFAVVNYEVYPFDELHQPWLAQGNQGILVPHIVLTGEGGKSNGLRLRSQWSPEERYFTLYSGNKQLTFVDKQSTAFSGDTWYTAPMQRVTVDDGSYVFFVPVNLVCEVFGFISGGEYPTEWGTMVRIRNPNTFSDEIFVKDRSSFIIEKYNEYISSLPSPEPSPGPSGLLPSPPAFVSPSPDLFPVSVYLTFDGAAGGATGRLLDFLENRWQTETVPALFFLPPESLAGDPAAARRIAARHQIGLLLDEPDGEALDDEARRGNILLRETAFIKTWLLRADNAPSEPSGYRYWGYDRRFSETESARDIIDAVTPLLQKASEPTVLVLSFPHSDAAVDALEELLPLIGRDNIWHFTPGGPPVR
jgi:hypothetical protein